MKTITLFQIWRQMLRRDLVYVWYGRTKRVQYRCGPLVETGVDDYSIRERLNLKHMAENESRSSKRGKMRDFQLEEDFEYEMQR